MTSLDERLADPNDPINKCDRCKSPLFPDGTTLAQNDIKPDHCPSCEDIVGEPQESMR